MYEHFYGLTGKPFQLSPDARFFYNSKGHNRAMAYLRYGLRQGEGFIVITGGIGTGKTMLVNNLFQELDRENVVAAHLVSTQVDEDDVLRMVNSAFGLDHEGLSKAALLRNLEDFFHTRQAEGKRSLLVVDEAQNLPPRSIEELRMLSNYQVGGQALLQSFLLGQAELKQTLQSPEMEQVRQRIIAGYHLRPLDREEMEAYVEHRLGTVGWQGRPHITSSAFDLMYEATGGIPRRVNTLGDRLLLFGALEELEELAADDARTVIEEVIEEMGPLDAGTPSPRGSPPAPGQGDLAARVAALEHQVERLQGTLQKERRLLRKAILLQMEMDDDDELG